MDSLAFPLFHPGWGVWLQMLVMVFSTYVHKLLGRHILCVCILGLVHVMLAMLIACFI